MVFCDDDLPHIFDPKVPKDDILQSNSITYNLKKSELKKLLEGKGFNGDGKGKN